MRVDEVATWHGIDCRKIENGMNGMLGVLVGAVIAAGGFLLMRNPMRFASLAPMERGVYQRAVLDTGSRCGFRILAAFICLFGTVILAAGLGGVLESKSLDAVSGGLEILLGFVFIGLFLYGIVQGAIWTIKGNDLFKRFQVRKVGIELGPISVFPENTPKMQREAQLFTIGLLGAVVATAIASILLRG